MPEVHRGPHRREEDGRADDGPGRSDGQGMKWIDFRGARGSNTGDDFHELWATRQAIRLLSNENGLEAIAVEGLSASDEAGALPDTWDGVDCTQYFGGRDAIEADHVRIEQLKYSAAYPNKSWTIARLVADRRGQSVIARLAKAWKGLTTLGSKTSSARAVLISNQPVDEDVLSAVQRADRVIPEGPESANRRLRQRRKSAWHTPQDWTQRSFGRSRPHSISEPELDPVSRLKSGHSKRSRSGPTRTFRGSLPD